MPENGPHCSDAQAGVSARALCGWLTSVLHIGFLQALSDYLPPLLIVSGVIMGEWVDGFDMKRYLGFTDGC